MKKSIKLVSTLVMLAGLGIASSAMANGGSPCAEAGGWTILAGTNMSNCKGLSHFYNCKVTQVVNCHGSSKVYVKLNRTYQHGKHVDQSIADKKVVFDGAYTAKDACAKVYKLDYQH